MEKLTSLNLVCLGSHCPFANKPAKQKSRALRSSFFLLNRVLITCPVTKIQEFNLFVYMEVHKWPLWHSYLIIHSSNGIVLIWPGESDYRSKPSKVQINCCKRVRRTDALKLLSWTECEGLFQLWLTAEHSWYGNTESGLQKLSDQRWKALREGKCNSAAALKISARFSQRSFCSSALKRSGHRVKRKAV